MKYTVIALIALFFVSFGAPRDQSFNGTFAWLNDGVMTGSCGIYYNTLRDKIAIISAHWFSSPSSSDDSKCKFNLKVIYQGTSITLLIPGASSEDQHDKVELSYAAFYALNPSNDKGYNAVFAFVNCH